MLSAQLSELSRLRSFLGKHDYFQTIVRAIGLTLFIIAIVVGDLHQSNPLELGIYFLLILFAEFLPIRFSIGVSNVITGTMTMPIVIGLLLSHGAGPTISLAPISIAIASFVINRKRYPVGLLIRMVTYNTAMIIISIACASIVYILVGGSTFVDARDISLAAMFWPLVLWVATCSAVNVALLAMQMSSIRKESWRLHAIQYMRLTLPSQLLTAPFGLLFAYLYMEYGIYGILLIVLPFLIGRQALNQYSTQLQAYRDTITTLGSYMQHYHPYTKGHLERVADLSDKLARHMRLSVPSLMYIRDAGLLHDIGKVGIGEDILDKVGKLTDEEWATIKQHPARGAEIITEMKFLECIVDWIRGHHERPDGKGYPDGLKYGEISTEAAIIAVADAFDAMTGGPDEEDQRVYRNRLTLDQAMAQVRYGAGTQFDPRVVKAFMQIMTKEGVQDDR